MQSNTVSVIDEPSRVLEVGTALGLDYGGKEQELEVVIATREEEDVLRLLEHQEEGWLRGTLSRSMASKHITGLLNGPNDSPYVRVFGSKNVSCGGVAVSSNQAVYINFEEVKDMMGYW
ncbi:hypothetical protein LWI29_024949 [Acer saccharum]|uniref:Uncharacterized protein n=1 Tax=Acer saccharum TaxID=4024 RepID=A0AA39SX41_ACESA|nr:hypothetical protein LWI29_024949 [Acer saccharum]